MSLGSIHEPRKLGLWLIVALMLPLVAQAQEGVPQPGDDARQRASEPTPADTVPTTKEDEAEPSSSWVESTPSVNEPPSERPAPTARSVPAEQKKAERN